MIISDSKDIQSMVDFIVNNKKISFDIETTGLNPRKDSVVGFGVSNESEGYYIIHQKYVNGTLVEVISKQECINVLNLLTKSEWIGHNSSFEARFCLHYFGINLKDSIWSDSMLLKHTVDEESPFALKEIAEKLFGVDAKKEQMDMLKSVKDNGGSEKEYYKADAELLGKYCIQDCLLTFAINEHYLKDLRRQGLDSFYFKDEVMPMLKEVVIPMELAGVELNQALLKQANDDLAADLLLLEDKIQAEIAPLLDQFNIWFLDLKIPPRRTGEFAQYVAAYAGLELPKTATGKFSLTEKALKALPSSIYTEFLLGGDYLPRHIVLEIQHLWLKDQEFKYSFNLLSKDHLKRLFFDRLEEMPLSKTEKGNPQVDDAFLDIMADKYPWAKDLRTYNKLNKIKGTYIERFLTGVENGRYYPGWMMHRTVTGRLSGDFQQLPRKRDEDSDLDSLVIKYTNIIRDLIISKPENCLLVADYSSLEVVVFADDAGDEPLLDIIKTNKDFYSQVAIDVFGLKDKYSSDKTADNFLKNHEPKIRQDTKSWGLGIRYNMQAFKLSKTLDISEKKAQKIINDYFLSYPKLKARMEYLKSFAQKNGYVSSKGGRIKRVPMLKKLHASYGEDLIDGLKLWEKYNNNTTKYSQMKYLAKQYRGDINAVMNFPIQSMAASITSRACIAIMREFKRLKLDARVIMQIHDEVVIECHESQKDKVSKIMKYCMENTIKLDAPLTAEPQIGKIYGELK